MDKLFNVPKSIFYKFIKSNKTIAKDGDFMHSTVYYNKKGELMAYKETSSYGAGTIYQIRDKKYENYSTVQLISNLLK